jgi:hypothetical protein
LLGEDGGFGLPGCDVAEGYEESVVDGAAVVENGAGDLLDAFDIKRWEACRVVDWFGELDMPSILGSVVAVGRVLGTLWSGMFVFGESCRDVSGHGHGTGSLFVIPFDGDAAVKAGIPVDGDGFVIGAK